MIPAPIPALHWNADLRWEDGTELFEYMCQQANQTYTLMVGEGTSVDVRAAFRRLSFVRAR